MYRIRFHRLASIRLTPLNENITIEIKVWGWRKQLDFLNSTNTPEKKKSTLPKGNKQKTSGIRVSWKAIRKMLASFQITKFDVSLDSGNMPLNGILYPLFYFIKIRTGKDLQINFLKENKIIIEIKNSLARLSWAYISS